MPEDEEDTAAPIRPDARLHVVESTDWRQGVIALLRPESPYRPWLHGDREAAPGEPVMVILNTEPRSVVATVGRVGPGGGLDRITLDVKPKPPGLLHLQTFVVMLATGVYRGDPDPSHDWILHDHLAEEVEERLRRTFPPRSTDFGHTSMAAASVLLNSDGVCDCCWESLDLVGANAQDRLRIRTVDYEVWPARRSGVVRRDWPGALCERCHDAAKRGQLDNFLDMIFAQNPPCPECGAEATTFIRSDAFSWMNNPPWIRGMGCTNNVRAAPKWSCQVCDCAWFPGDEDWERDSNHPQRPRRKGP